MASVAPMVTTTSVSGSWSRPYQCRWWSATAWRSAGSPAPGGYWLCPARMAATAASATSAGPSVSGKPCPRLMDPVRAARTDISLKMVVVKGWRWAPMALRMGLESTGAGSAQQTGVLLGHPSVQKERRSGLRQLAPHGAVGVALAVDVHVEGRRVGDQLGGGVGREIDAGLGLEGGLSRGEGGHQVDQYRTGGPPGALVDVGLGRLLPHGRLEVVATLAAGDVEGEGADAVLH